MRTMPAIAALVSVLVTSGALQPNRALLKNPDDQAWTQRAPDVCRIRLDTSKGSIVIEMTRAWSPHGVDRFYNLVRHGYYDEARIFRIRAGQWAQFGINADPEIATVWRNRTIPDDPRQVSNARGTLSYAFKDPNGRTTQLFFNLRDNAATHDQEPFVPIARIVEGIDVPDAWYSEYGESAGGGIRGGKQDPLFAGGNSFLMQHFPKLDFIKQARIQGR